MKNRFPRKGFYIYFLFAFLGSQSFSLFNNPCSAQNQTNTPSYELLVSQADQASKSKDYPTALLAYERARNVKPEIKYAQGKIDEINAILDSDPGLRAKLFEDVLLVAETYYNQRIFAQAKTEYQKALLIDPTAQFPKDRLTQISAIFTDPDDQAYFNNSVTSGDQALSGQDFDKAILFYETALAVKPDNKAVKEKITNARKQQSEYKIKTDQAAALIAGGDKLLKADKLTEARVEYQKALDITPNNAYARQKMQEAEKILADRKASQDNYDKVIEQADQYYINRDFANAQAKYAEALKAKPGARYPTEMLEKTKSGEAQVQTSDERYNVAIGSADNLLAGGNYEAAAISYKSALEIKPNEAYPKTKLAEIDKLVKERTTRKEAYDIAIKNGDQAFDDKKYDLALGHYRNAISLMPYEKYPDTRITEINNLLEKQKLLGDYYQKSITEADRLFNQKLYEDAIKEYTKALELKPKEAYPEQKINEAIAQLALMKSREENYTLAVANGDKAFSEQKYEDALSAYTQALTLKPNEKYPKDKSDEINRILAKLKADSQKYETAIANADKAFKAGNLDVALTEYKNALGIKPGEKYPTDKIAEVTAAIEQMKQTDEKYLAAITTGDKQFAAKDYETALTAYTEAADLKLSEKYPRDQVAKINSILAAMHSAEENYTKAIADGDAYFGAKNYPEAIIAYTKAGSIKPAETYPKKQLEKINSLVAAQKRLDADYLAAIGSADKDFAAKNYESAISGYRKALDLKSSEKYPQDRIAEASKIVAVLKALQESYDKAISDADKSFSDKDYTSALASYKNAGALKPAEAYPKQKITEVQAILDKDKAEGQRYQEAITQADKLFNDKKYTEALEPYQRAANIKPSEKYPHDQVTLINRNIAEQKKLDEDYAKLITDADAQFKTAGYNDSRKLYTDAATLKPAEKLPKDRIAEIDGILADLQNKEQSYAKHITEGDAAFAEKRYTEAIASYTNALKVKSAETYPKTQIDKINGLVAEQKKLDAGYLAAVASADKNFSDKKYPEAISGYRKALELKLSEKYPSEKITETEKILAEIKAIQDSYDKAITEADKYFSAKDYANALSSYQGAGTLKPGEVYPKQKIVEVQAIIDKDKAEGQRYQVAIAQADKLYNDKKYSEALEPYQRASNVKPAEQYPKDQISNINRFVAEQKKLDEDYTKLITDADTKFKATKYDESRSLYSDASTLKPAEKLPKDKIAEIDGIIAAMQLKEKNYTDAIKEADAFFAGKKYTEAISSYTKALAVKPAESYPKLQVEKINGLIADQKKLDDNYLAIITGADKLFEISKYPEAITDYRKALVLKPSEKYPADKIAEAEKQIADLKAKQMAYDKAIADGDAKLAAKEYEVALASFKTANSVKPDEKYPVQKITEIQAIIYKIKADNDNYNTAIALADNFFADGKYREALEPYQRASTVKPSEKYPQDQIAHINLLLAEAKKLDDDYRNLVTQAGTHLTAKNYTEARNLFAKAGALKPTENLPKDKIAEIDSILADLKARDENYAKALNTASELYAAKNLQGAVKSYEEALDIKPAEKLPQERITAIKAEIKAIDDSYSKAITIGDSKLSAKNFPDALNAYQNALEIKPAEEYPKSKISEINTALAAQKEEQEKMYNSYIAEGDQLLGSKDYKGAKTAFTKAGGIKPTEVYPKQKLAEIDKIVGEIELARRAEYNKALGEADKLYNTKVYDQAIDAYETASAINPDDSYPQLQISKIRKYMADHAIQDLYSQSLFIKEGEEKKFTFSAIEPRLRKNDYVLLKARSAGKTVPKVYLSYGKDSQKNGSIVLRSIDKTTISDLLIRLSGQDKWYREDNNWLSLYIETGEIEITRIQIAAGEE